MQEHTKNERFEVSLPVAEFCGLSSSIFKICTSFVYMKLRGCSPGAGKVHLKCSNKKLV